MHHHPAQITTDSLITHLSTTSRQSECGHVNPHLPQDKMTIALYLVRLLIGQDTQGLFLVKILILCSSCWQFFPGSGHFCHLKCHYYLLGSLEEILVQPSAVFFNICIWKCCSSKEYFGPLLNFIFNFYVLLIFLYIYNITDIFWGGE